MLSDKILITGASGFIGYTVYKTLTNRGYWNIAIPNSRQYDLTQQDFTKSMFDDHNPEIVIHLAALVGGIHANNTMKGKFFYENIMINTNVFEQARRHGVKKLVCMGSGCIYPRDCPQPIKEEYLWDGYPEETNAPYAFAKRMLVVQSQAYREQYGFNSIIVMPGNVYGPGRDNFHLEHSHVVPALIKKFSDAVKNGDDEVVVWGSGKATRDFIHVDDLANATVQLMEKYDSSEPINVSTGIETSIKELVELIADLTGFKGKIVWDASKPDGQPRRQFDITRMESILGNFKCYSIRDGLKQTIEWYNNNRHNVRLDEK